MGYCKAWKDNTRDPCNESTDPGYAYCGTHKNRRGAANERARKELGNIVDAADIFGGNPIEPRAGARKEDTAPEVSEPSNSVATKSKQQPPTINKAYEVAQRCFEMLDRSIDFEDKAWQRLLKLPEEQWRYTDKAGAEQLRGEVSVYERAMDRTLRAVTAVAKLNIDAQAVNINKVVREMIKGVVMRVFQRMELDQQQIDQARKYLAEEFEKVSKDD